jgi:hypothetical protein
MSALLAAVLALGAGVAAQNGATFAGRLVNSLSGDPIPGAAVQIDELKRQVTSAPDGSFSFDAVPPGTYHLSVRADGYSSRRTEVTVSAVAAPPMRCPWIRSCTSRRCSR